MEINKGLLADLEVILEELVVAFDDATEGKQGTMTLQSKVGSRFHQRVTRTYRAIVLREDE